MIHICLQVLREHTLGPEQLVNGGLDRAGLRIVLLEEALEHTEVAAVELAACEKTPLSC